MARETEEAAEIRRKKLKLLQGHYTRFRHFMTDMMAELGFGSTWMQCDIADYLEDGPQELMVQAQRGEAKTTITAIYAVYCLIHDPKHRVLIVSAGGKTANEIATLVQKLILTVDVLECLRPDPNNGDRTSVEAFDVHYTLKGIDKSPSVACVGITGNLPGKRADLLIADDVESTKNSRTAAMREILMMLCNEFSSICSKGRVVYLGTPQTGDSIYNTLAGKGFAIRVWPGRYPTPAELPNYGEFLAPSIRRRLMDNPELAFGGGLDGQKGQPTDPALLDEETLCTKEKKGAAYFQLNFMLNTRLTDAERFPLKLEKIVVLRNCDGINFPTAITRGINATALKAYQSSGLGFNLSLPHTLSDTLDKLAGIHMRVDPAGGGANADETSYAVTGFLNGNVYVLAVGGVPGGYETADLEKLAQIAGKYAVNAITVEKNMGHGAFTKVWLPILRKYYKGGVEDEFVTGMKEARIIDTLEPIMARGSLIFLEEVIQQDNDSTEKYASTGKRITYSLFHQLSKLAKIKKCLAHDDRADALEGSVRHWVVQLGIDQDEKAKLEEAAKLAAFMKDPLGHNRYGGGPTPKYGSVLDRFRR